MGESHHSCPPTRAAGLASHGQHADETRGRDLCSHTVVLASRPCASLHAAAVAKQDVGANAACGGARVSDLPRAAGRSARRHPLACSTRQRALAGRDGVRARARRILPKDCAISYSSVLSTDRWRGEGARERCAAEPRCAQMEPEEGSGGSVEFRPRDHPVHPKTETVERIGQLYDRPTTGLKPNHGNGQVARSRPHTIFH